MNKNFYLNFIATLILLILIIIGFAVIWISDKTRSETGKIRKQLLSIEAKINDAGGGKIISGNSKKTESRTSKVSGTMANVEFYDKNAKSGGRLITAVMSETKNLNYLVNNEAFVSSLWSYCNDSLAERNYEHIEKFEPQIAESWKLSKDKLVFTVKLKKGILWHDFSDPVSGKKWENVEVTAQDFKFYVDVIKNLDTDCAPARTYMMDLEKIEVVNDYEFKVYWKKPYFLSEVITLGLSPLPRHLYHAYDGPFDGKKFNDDHERNRIIVGCGPYRFDKWDKGRKIILTKWDKYYGRKYGVMPPIDYLAFEVIKHPNTQFQALLSESIDRMGLTPDQWVNRTNIKEFEEGGKLRKLKYTGRFYSYIGYNLRNPLFSDKIVRQALTHLVDRKRILRDVYHNLGRIVTGNFFIDSPYYDKNIKPYEFSVEKAKELFKKAGWTDSNGDGILDRNGKKFEFTVLAPSGSETLKKMLPMIKEDMAKAGVVMNIHSIEWSVYTQRLEKKSFEVCVLGWSMSFESDPYQLWHSSQAEKPGSSNHIGFKNKKADELIEKIRVTFDLEKRIKLCHEFHRLLHEEQPYTFLFSPYSLMGQNNRYKNVRIFPVGVPAKIMWVPTDMQKD